MTGEEFPCDLAELREGPEVFRDLLVRYRVIGRAEARRLAEEQERREWAEGIRRRLGLVAEVHRCQVWRCGWEWAWLCAREGCPVTRAGYPSQPAAFKDALTHARAFVPDGRGPLTDLEWALYAAACEDAVRRLTCL